MNSLIKFLVITLLFASCMPTEDPVDPFPRGDRQEELIYAGEFKNSINFYSLDDKELVGTAEPMDWDIFVVNGKLMINMFRHLYVAEYNGDVLNKLDTTGLTFSHLERDTGMWELYPGIDYVIDLGQNNAFEHQGFHKLRVVKNNNQYSINHAALEDQLWKNITLDAGEYANLRIEQKVDLPAFGSYDVIFGKYTHYFEVEEILYEVYGAISFDSEIAISNESFESIDANGLDSLKWSDAYDAIGFDWKNYNLDKGAYEIDSDKIFVIRSDQDFIYKFRFTNFYDVSGTSGHPTFEFEVI